MAAGLNDAIRMYENRTVVKQTAFTGSGEVPLYTLSGSRMLITLQVTEIEPGTTVNLYVDNGFDRDLPYDTIENLSQSTVSSIKRILSDFNNLFNFRYTVTGGMATFSVGIAVYDNAGTTRIDNAQLDVDLDHTTDALGHFDSTRIGDGHDLLGVNEDGSINVVDDLGANETPLFPYDEAPLVASGLETDVLTYTVPIGKISLLYRCEVSGENIAQYKIYLNGTAIATRRTHHGSGLSTEFDFTTPNKRSVQLEAGDVITVRVLHNRPEPSNHEARYVLLEKATA